MSQSVELKYNGLPAVMPSYARAAARWSDHMADDGAMPSITARVNAIKVRADNLGRYREVCAFPDTAALPITYPHVWAFPLQMAVLTHKRFPLKLLGLVHVRNEIIQQRAIDAEETLSLVVRTGDCRQARRGLEFDLITEIRDSNSHIVWTETGTMLSRQPDSTHKKTARRQSAESVSADYDQNAHWDVAANIGRRYASVAGDYNPIHLSAFSARLFGFRQTIATGMWLKARIAAELMPYLPSSSCKIAVAFRRPVYVPGSVSLRYSLHQQGGEFALTNPAGDINHLQGQLSYTTD